MAVNDADDQALFDNRYGTGQSTLDGILRATNVLLAGKTFVVGGYGWCGRGLASRARGMGANVVVSEVDPLRALEAVDGRFPGHADGRGRPDRRHLLTVTGDLNVLAADTSKSMKDGAILANSGHFNVEIDVAGLREVATTSRWRGRWWSR